MPPQRPHQGALTNMTPRVPWIRPAEGQVGPRNDGRRAAEGANVRAWRQHATLVAASAAPFATKFPEHRALCATATARAAAARRARRLSPGPPSIAAVFA